MNVLELQLHHAYFPDGFLKYVNLVPTRATLDFLNRYRVSLKSSKDKVVLVYTGKLAFDLFLSEFSELMGGTSLIFEVKYQGVGFNVFTDIPLGNLGPLKFSNVKACINESNREKKELSFVCEKGQLAFDNTIINIVIDPDFLKGDLLGGVKVYTLNINSRKTLWTYNVQNKGKARSSNLKIRNQKGKFFDQGSELVTKNGEEFKVFVVGAVEMQLTYGLKDKFSLVALMNLGEGMPTKITKNLISELCSPSIDDFVVKEIDGEKKACSDMFVYL